MHRVDLPKGVHRVRRKLADGKSRFHFYAWRGGPKFWTDDHRKPSDLDGFFAALAEAAQRPKPSGYMTPQMVDEFLSSTAIPKGKRSQADIRLWALRFAEHFKDAPAIMFQERGSRGVVNEWRAMWKHSPKQHDMAGTHAVRVLNWAVEEGKLTEHHCHKLHRIYEVDRSDIVWTRADRAAFDAKAPEWVRRILCTACETGLRPGDLIRLTVDQIENTPKGRRLRVKTNKRGRPAYIPVTLALASVIDATPHGSALILANAGGNPLTEQRASEAVRQWRQKAKLSDVLRLYDARGTAATRLLDSGLSLKQIAERMGWSLRTAASVIEHYAHVSPDETDSVMIKLELAKRNAACTRL